MHYPEVTDLDHHLIGAAAAVNPELPWVLFCRRNPFGDVINAAAAGNHGELDTFLSQLDDDTYDHDHQLIRHSITLCPDSHVAAIGHACGRTGQIYTFRATLRQRSTYIDRQDRDALAALDTAAELLANVQTEQARTSLADWYQHPAIADPNTSRETDQLFVAAVGDHLDSLTAVAESGLLSPRHLQRDRLYANIAAAAFMSPGMVLDVTHIDLLRHVNHDYKIVQAARTDAANTYLNSSACDDLDNIRTLRAANWRDTHPNGTRQQLVDAIGTTTSKHLDISYFQPALDANELDTYLHPDICDFYNTSDNLAFLQQHGRRLSYRQLQTLELYSIDDDFEAQLLRLQIIASRHPHHLGDFLATRREGGLNTHLFLQHLNKRHPGRYNELAVTIFNHHRQPLQKTLHHPAVAAHLAEQFGTNVDLWDTLYRLASDWNGTGKELVDTTLAVNGVS